MMLQKLWFSLSAVLMMMLMLKAVSHSSEADLTEWLERREAWRMSPPEYIQRAAALEEMRFPCVGNGCLTAEDMTTLSWSLERYAAMAGFTPELLTGILMVENPWLDSTAVSYAGAVGLMQVMPLHDGEFPQCGSLYTVEGNVCYGANVLRMKVLHLYNGCVYAYCRDYDDRVVLRTVRR